MPAVKTSWMIWMPAQYVNFKFVPLNLRVSDWLWRVACLGSVHDAAGSSVYRTSARTCACFSCVAQVTFDAVVALLWNVYLSFQTHRAVTSVS